ncbi:AraC-like DNA-binding protein [Streptomyces sp. V1I1]|nr:AraC-like DNA-binding protein [Streptomyces sp. V1I1]
MGALLSRYLSELATSGHEFRADDSARLSTITLDLIWAVIARGLDAEGSLSPSARQRVLLVRIHAFIQQRLGDVSLSPDMIAAAHGISTRSLHRLFRDQGVTVTEWIRARRLDRCRRDLADPLLQTRPVHAIAARWGFTNAACRAPPSGWRSRRPGRARCWARCWPPARLPSRFGYGAVLVSAAALGDGVFLCVPALHGSSAVTVPALLAVNFVFGTGGQLVNVTVMAVRQAVTPDGMQGRAAATITFVGMGMTPLGSMLGGFLAEEWGLRASLLVTAAGMMLSPALIALSPLARLGRYSATPPGPRRTHTTRGLPRRRTLRLACGLWRTRYLTGRS